MLLPAGESQVCARPVITPRKVLDPARVRIVTGKPLPPPGKRGPRSAERPARRMSVQITEARFFFGIPLRWNLQISSPRAELSSAVNPAAAKCLHAACPDTRRRLPAFISRSRGLPPSSLGLVPPRPRPARFQRAGFGPWRGGRSAGKRSSNDTKGAWGRPRGRKTSDHGKNTYHIRRICRKLFLFFF